MSGPIDYRPVRDYGVQKLSALSLPTTGYDYPVAALSQYILDTIVATYTSKASVATPLPARRLITIGSVAVDSPLLAVMFGGLSVGPPGNEMNAPRRGETDPRTSSWNIELWRLAGTSLPNGMPGTADAITHAAQVIMQDTWLLLESAYECDRLGVGVIANVQVNEPQGDMIGSSMVLELQVP